MNVVESVEEFLAAKRQEGRTPATVRQYRWRLLRLAAVLADQGVVELDGITRVMLRHWGADLLDEYAPATVKVAVTAVHSWLTWCLHEGLLTTDLSKALRYPRVPMKLQRTLSRDDVGDLMAACDPATAVGARDAAMVALLVDSGLRRRELVGLTLAAVDLERGHARIVRKGGDEGLAWFGLATATRLRRWLCVRPEVAEPGVTALFVAVGGSTPGRPLTGEGLRTVLRKLGERAGVEGVTPHAFRRTFATLRLENGDSTRAVQALGGWKKIDLVERYSQALDLSRLARQNAPMDALDLPIALQLPLFADGRSER